jgi:hypothetical protein
MAVVPSPGEVSMSRRPPTLSTRIRVRCKPDVAAGESNGHVAEIESPAVVLHDEDDVAVRALPAAASSQRFPRRRSA